MRLHGCSGPCVDDVSRESSLSFAEIVEKIPVPPILATTSKTLPFPLVDGLLVEDFETIYTGYRTRNSDRVTLSLTKSCLIKAGKEVRVARTWDIDSVILDLTSLGAYVAGTSLFFIPKFSKVLTHAMYTKLTRENLNPSECK
jgi:hypothetical protein